MPKKKKTVDVVAEPRLTELPINESKSTTEETPKMTKEEMEKKKEEIKHEWTKKLMFDMYRHQIIECINYLLNHRLSIEALKELIKEKKADKKELHSASRDFMRQIDPVAFVELVHMLNPNIDFSDKYDEGDKLLVRTESKVADGSLETKEESEVSDGN